MGERVETLRSLHLGNERTVWIRPPRNAARARHLTVFLDAEMYREKVGAPAIVDAIAAEPDRADSWFVYVSSVDPDTRWKECPCHPPFAAFLADEFLPWLFRLEDGSAETSVRTLVGLSYTGLAAAYVAKERPGLFQRVVAQSGSFWWSNGWLIDQYAAEPLRTPAEFYLEVGTRETQTDLQHHPEVFQATSQLEAVRAFRDVLENHGYAVTHVETDGAHDTAAWARGLPDALRWATRHARGFGF